MCVKPALTTRKRHSVTQCEGIAALNRRQKARDELTDRITQLMDVVDTVRMAELNQTAATSLTQHKNKAAHEGNVHQWGHFCAIT
jgi:acetyl-CoA carboxylase carboxyltransferase component